MYKPNATENVYSQEDHMVVQRLILGGVQRITIYQNG